MLGIKAIGSYIPSTLIDNYGRVEQFGTDETFVRDKTGFVTLARKSPEEDTSDLCVKAFKDLTSLSGLHPDPVDCIVVCTQNPDGKGLPHTSAIVHRKLGLKDDVASFDISLGCSGYVYGLSVIISFMSLNGFGNGLLFTADPYSKILNSADRNTELLFGDAATCTWISGNPVFGMLKSRFATSGSGWDAIMIDEASEFLSMKGKDVFLFSMKKVPLQIEQCLEDNSLTKPDIDLFILHQGSKYIVDNLMKQLQIPAEKVPFHARGYGNTISSSIPLVLKDMLESKNNLILLSGFGVGLSWATTVLKKNILR
jgi:3-oxoacyl-[acyl-carrier-protein] synthase-3